MSKFLEFLEEVFWVIAAGAGVSVVVAFAVLVVWRVYEVVGG